MAPGTFTGAGPGTDLPRLVELMGMTREQWDVWTRGSAIRRAGYAGFKRNVAVGLGNWQGLLDEPPEEAVAVLIDALDDEEPLVRGHAAWAVGRIGSAEAGKALTSALRDERDLRVRKELELALVS